MKVLTVASGLMIGLATLSVAIASVPRKSRVTDDTAIYQNLSEIEVAKEEDLNFDNDIRRLEARERLYGERLRSISDNPRLAGPMQRIQNQPYRYAGAQRPAARKSAPIRR